MPHFRIRFLNPASVVDAVGWQAGVIEALDENGKVAKSYMFSGLGHMLDFIYRERIDKLDLKGDEPTGRFVMDKGSQ